MRCNPWRGRVTFLDRSQQSVTHCRAVCLAKDARARALRGQGGNMAAISAPSREAWLWTSSVDRADGRFVFCLFDFSQRDRDRERERERVPVCATYLM